MLNTRELELLILMVEGWRVMDKDSDLAKNIRIKDYPEEESELEDEDKVLLNIKSELYKMYDRRIFFSGLLDSIKERISNVLVRR